MQQHKTQSFMQFAKAGILAALLTTSFLTPVKEAKAQVPTPASTNVISADTAATQVYDAANGVKVVDIADPNAAGLSHNKFHEYNVDSRGLVLNNGDISATARQSQLAGQVAANLNLTSEANLILNEVVSANRSTLAGFTEVLGQSADVIVANPYGITCNGCGFINVPNATLTTGAPQISAGGQLTGFQVGQGDILITGTGLDALDQDYLGIIGRAIKLEAQVNAKDLDIIAGANNWNYGTKTATPIAGTGPAPVLAVDSSALGGMYANRIRLIATEAGVGVRMLGEAAVGVGDFDLTSAGKVELNGDISAERDVKITTTATGTQSIRSTNAKITAKNDVTISATGGEAELNGGTITSGNDLRITSQSLKDTGTVDATNADNNKRYAEGKLYLTQTGKAAIENMIYGGKLGLVTNTGDFITRNTGATFYSDAALNFVSTGNMDMTNVVMRAAGDINVNASNGFVKTLSQSKIQSTAGALYLWALNGYTNEGSLSSDTSTAALYVSGLLNNTGTIQAQTNLTLNKHASGGNFSVSNAGTLLAARALTMNAHQLTNQAGGLIQGNYTSSLALASSLINSGTIILGKDAGTNGIITAASLTNNVNSIIQSAGTQTINVATLLSNSGKILAGNDIQMRSISGANVINNSTGIIQATNTLKMVKSAGSHEMTFSTQAGTVRAGLLDLKLKSLNNTGTMQGDSSVMTVTDAFTQGNGAKFIASSAGNSATIRATTLDNAGTLQSAGNLNLNIGSLYENGSTGKLVGDGNVLIRGVSNTAYSVRNAGYIQSAADLSIKGYADRDSVNIYGVGGAGKYIGQTIDMVARTISLDNGSGITSFGNMDIDAATLSVLGASSYVVASTANHSGIATITTANQLSNYGAIFSNGRLNLNVNSNILNKSTGGIAAYGTADINAAANGQVTNEGAFYAGTLLDIYAGSRIDNKASGTMDSDRDITINSDYFVNTNDVNAKRNLAINALVFKNEIAGGDKREWTYNIGDNTTNSGWSSSPGGLLWGESANKYYTRKWSNEQYYVGGAPSAADKPRLIADGTLTITNFQSALNLGGIISAPTVNINSSRVGAVFTNDSYALRTDNRKKTWYSHVSCCSDVIYLDYTYNNGVTTVTESTSYTDFGAGIFAGTLNAAGFALTNAGAIKSASVSGTSKNGASSTSGTTGVSATSGAAGTSFGTITITLPSNPNGYFVVNKDPNAQYLVETNPLYGAGSSVGSERMIERLGLDPDQVQKRLGDGSYEASLVRDQLTAELGSTVINVGDDQATQMQRLMDNGVDQATTLGLEYGKPLTNAQLANLQDDMVWMVETEVAGQKVLAPMVYLSAATKSAFASGAAIIGKNVNMDLASVNNTGGTIGGSETLSITSKGDIHNLSGTIQGGDVSLSSTDGSIINETYANTTGDDKHASTVIGDTAGIVATGNLSLDAKDDITNKGANVSAGGDASLTAGGDITFDTIENKTADTTHEFNDNGVFDKNTTSTTELSIKNIGSGLTVGGNLTSNSGGDTTIRGSKVDVAGNADMTSGGDINIVDVQDVSQTTTDSTKSGAGVGGGVWGTNTVNEVHTKKDSMGSDVNIGGNTNMTADGTLTLQGSDLAAGGNLDIKADEVLILEGRNEETTTRTETTTTFLKVEDGDTSSGSSSDSESGSGAGGEKAAASASAEANANANAEGGVTLSSTEVTQTDKFKSTGKASNISSGGNMSIDSNNDITVRGSNVEAGGDVDLTAENVNILASQDIETTTTTTTKVSIGLYADSKNEANANADAEANADGGGASAHANANGIGANAGDANADASASASADASSESTLDFAVTRTDSKSTLDITNTGSSIKSGGNMNIKAKNTLDVAGSDIEAGGDANVEAKDIIFRAVDDVHVETTSSDETRAGIYFDASADASAEASAEADAGDLSAEAGGSAEANANADFGAKLTNTAKSSTSGSTTAVTSSIKSGGNMTRKAENKITDVGTQIEAGGDFTQESKEWDSKAAENTTFSSSESETNTGKFGVYAEAGASASASADSTGSVENEAGASAAVGVKASYNRETEGESASSSTAVTSMIKSGGKMKTTTTGKTSLEGTNLESGGDMEMNAGSLDYKAARNTETSSSDSSSIDAELKVGVDATKAVSFGASGAYEGERENSSSSTAVVGGMKSGGNLKINTKDDARFEGTNIEAKGDAGVKAGGDLTFDAARNTETTSESGENVSASIQLSKSKGGGKGSKGAGFEAEGGMSNKDTSSSEAVTGGIKSGGKLDLSSGGDMNFEGTDLQSGGDATVDAKGDVNFNAAESTSSETSYGFDASISASKGGKDSKGKAKGSETGLEASGNYSQSDETTSKASGLNSGGNLTIKSGKSVTLEGTNIDARGKAAIDAKDNVNFKTKTDTKTSIGVEAELSVGKSKAAKGGDTSDDGTDFGAGGSIEGEDTTTRTGGSIKAGDISISSGKDTTLEGTKLNSKTGTAIKAGGDVNLKAAESTSIEGDASLSLGSPLPSGNAGIGGYSRKEGVEIKGGSDLNIQSGGKTVMEGTKATVGGAANIDAQGGIEKSSNVSGGGEIGLTRGGADLKIENTEIKAGKGVSEKSGR